MVFLLSHVDVEAKERKDVATCTCSAFHFQVLGFLRHERQRGCSPKVCGTSRLSSFG